MKSCEVCGSTENQLVYSGVDALILGVMDQLEKICYDCANAKRLQEAAIANG
jgi:hypothetical protein